MQLPLRFSPDLPRLSGHRAAIVERLQRGPATNGELVQVGGIRFSARILELRRAGYRISTSVRDHETGLVVYQMDPEATA